MFSRNIFLGILVRSGSIATCFIFAEYVSLNHFLYVLLRERYVLYQVIFYLTLWVLSFATLIRWRLMYSAYVLVLSMVLGGYVASWMAFFFEPLVMFRSIPSLSSTQGFYFYRELFVSALLSLGWLNGLIVGGVIVMLTKVVDRKRNITK